MKIMTAPAPFPGTLQVVGPDAAAPNNGPLILVGVISLSLGLVVGYYYAKSILNWEKRLEIKMA